MKKRFRPKVLTVLCILGAVLCLLAGAVLILFLIAGIYGYEDFAGTGLGESGIFGSIRTRLCWKAAAAQSLMLTVMYFPERRKS